MLYYSLAVRLSTNAPGSTGTRVFFAVLGTFQIGKISVVNLLIGKFVKVRNYGIFGQLKNKFNSYTHTIAIKLKEK